VIEKNIFKTLTPGGDSQWEVQVGHISGAVFTTLFSLQLTNGPKRARVFVLGRFLLPSLMLASKARAYLKVESLKPPGLTHKY
jgi:hypothetical protein